MSLPCPQPAISNWQDNPRSAAKVASVTRIQPAASPRQSPARLRSNGRAPAGSSACSEEKPEWTNSVTASTATTSTLRCVPWRISEAAWASATEPEAHAAEISRPGSAEPQAIRTFSSRWCGLAAVPLPPPFRTSRSSRSISPTVVARITSVSGGSNWQALASNGASICIASDSGNARSSPATRPAGCVPAPGIRQPHGESAGRPEPSPSQQASRPRPYAVTRSPAAMTGMIIAGT